ncbi:hypothetical protein [Deinococcus aquaedulcis]|uniref:hypothetical protein n=1 Tax=Deinococcus aquaedulcis TaxID=2840455 RepID=UPI001C839D41|nr:hypothetical protein [Deinococcus aquaedulcis]
MPIRRLGLLHGVFLVSLSLPPIGEAATAPQTTLSQCVKQQLGADFNTLGKEVQLEILKNYERIITPECNQIFKKGEASFSPALNYGAYAWILGIGSIILLTLSFTKIFQPLVRDPKNNKDISVGRVIAMIGLFATILTYAFAARYGFWALSTKNDMASFEKMVPLLLPGVAAFLPYIANKLGS